MKKTRKSILTLGLISVIAMSQVYSVSAAKQVAVNGYDDWVNVMPATNSFDYQEDQQTGSGTVSQDLVGSTGYGVFYVKYDSDVNEIGFRMRINDADGNQKDQFKNFAFVGVDADLNGGIDCFIGVYNPTGNNGRVAIYNSNPSKLNVSPSTTGIGDVLKEYLPAANQNYSLMQTNDGSNFGGDADYFITFKVSVADINAALAAAGKSITITASTPIRYMIGTAAQDNAFNQDIGGIQGIDTKDTTTWEDLGVFSPPMTLSGNVAPSAADISATTPEDTLAAGNIGAIDANGDALSYMVKTDASNGTASVDASGNWSYTPDAGYAGTDSFVVTVSDGKGGTTDVTITITVTEAPPAENTAPSASDGSATTPEDTQVTGSIVATDADGDALSYVIKEDAAHGTASVDASGNWSYTPDAGYAGTDSFVVTVSDGKGGTTDVTITITVTEAPPAENTAPSASNGSATTPEDTQVTGSITATDADGDTLSYVLKTDAANGTASVDAGGNWSYTPDAGYAGTDSFVVTVSDGKGGTTDVTITITVTEAPPAENRAPSASDGSATTPEDTQVTGSITATDADGDSLSYVLKTDAANGAASVDASGNWSYTPDAGYTGSDSFVVTVSDGKGGTTDVTITITVTEAPPAENKAPMASNASVTTPEDTKVTGSIAATDADGDTLSYVMKTDAAHGTASVDASGSWSYTPVAGYTGTDSFVVTVSDGKGGTTDVTITITVTKAENKAPDVGGVAGTTTGGTQTTGKIVATDPEGDPLNYAVKTNPANGTAAVDASGNWSYTPNAGFTGTDSFIVTVSDGKGGTTDITIVVTVIAPAPVTGSTPSVTTSVTTAGKNVSAVKSSPNTGDASGILVSLAGMLISGGYLTFRRKSDK